MGAVEGEKYCLKWNDFTSNLSSAFNELRDDEDFFDVTLLTEESEIRCHKLILGACSPHFRYYTWSNLEFSVISWLSLLVQAHHQKVINSTKSCHLFTRCSPWRHQKHPGIHVLGRSQCCPRRSRFIPQRCSRPLHQRSDARWPISTLWRQCCSPTQSILQKFIQFSFSRSPYKEAAYDDQKQWRNRQKHSQTRA